MSEDAAIQLRQGDIEMRLEEAKALLMAIQWEFVAAQAAEIVENARTCKYGWKR